MKTALLWFKKDLRLHDNEPLQKALLENDTVIPVYCFDDNHFTITSFGFHKTGALRAQFLLESLEDLSRYLIKKGSRLVIVRGKPEEQLCSLAARYNACSLYTSNDPGFEENRTLEKVEQALLKTQCRLHIVDTHTLYHPQDLPFAISDTPFVFTDFRKKVEKESSIRAAIPAPAWIPSPSLEPMLLPSLPELGLEPKMIDARSVLPFKGGETAALDRMEAFIHHTRAIGTYKETRNGLIGADYSSKFSPWLAFGCLSARQIFQEVKKYEQLHGANDSTYWLVFELIWRDFFSCTMQQYPVAFFTPHGIRNGKSAKCLHNELLFEGWKEGRTEDDFVNANMMELKGTGFMSNRGRQNVASYLCHDLALDWRYGAAYFEEQLIDYDVCSNWCNWAYIAGVGNNPRGVSIFNVKKQANDYDPDASYRNLWLTNSGK